MLSYSPGDETYARNLSGSTSDCLAARFDSLSRGGWLYPSVTHRRRNRAGHAFCERPNRGVTKHVGRTVLPSAGKRPAPRRTLAMSLAALFLCAAAHATDFSGAWKMDPTRSESAHQAVPIGPVTLLIKQTPSEITVETRRATQREILTYSLDGTETTKQGITCRARWDGS